VTTLDNLTPKHRFDIATYFACEQSLDPDELAARLLAARLLWFADEVCEARARPAGTKAIWPNELWIKQQRALVRELRRTEARAKGDDWIALMDLADIVERVSWPLPASVQAPEPPERVLGEFRRLWPDYAAKLDREEVRDAVGSAYKPRKGTKLKKWDAFAKLARRVLDESHLTSEEVRKELGRLRRARASRSATLVRS
jgi:hypothetical protein